MKGTPGWASVRDEEAIAPLVPVSAEAKGS